MNMTFFAAPVREYMSTPVMTAPESEPVRKAEERLSTLRISALAVVDKAGGLIGVLSRTDLLRAGRVRLADGRNQRVLSLPDVPIGRVMTATVEVVAPEATLAEAARRMVRQQIHRLYVSSDRRP